MAPKRALYDVREWSYATDNIQKNRNTEKQKNRKTEKQKNRKTEKQTDGQNIFIALTGLEMSDSSRKHIKSGGQKNFFFHECNTPAEFTRAEVTNIKLTLELEKLIFMTGLNHMKKKRQIDKEFKK